MNRFKITSSLYEWISCAIPDRIYFGPLPNEYMLEKLKKNRFNLIVNLTENAYAINPGSDPDPDSDIQVIHYPIVDNSVPEDIHDYCRFIVSLKRAFDDKTNKIYIHCRAGHSRSSMVMVSLLFCIYNDELKDIVNKVIEYHRNRTHLRDIWRHRSPFNYKQFMFLCAVHKNVYVNIGADSKIYNWLSPKNIWVDQYTTLDSCVTQFGLKNTKELSELYDLVKNNAYFINKIKKTLLKKLTFLNEQNETDLFYEYFFKKIRENVL
jgi:protein-tyrosine phosphatase